jgi:hypothetical protein
VPHAKVSMWYFLSAFPRNLSFFFFHKYVLGGDRKWLLTTIAS